MSVDRGSLVLAYLPSPDRGVWMIGPVPIRAYALCIIVGIVVAVMWGERRFVERGGEPGTVTDVAVFAVPFGLVGGRLYHVLTDWKTYFGPGAHPVDALKIWHGGLGIWGAVALGAVGAWIGCRRRGVPLPFFADAVAPCIVTAQAIGRLGNWFNQELYGGPTTLPWGLEIFRRIDPATGLTDPLTGVAVDHTPIAVVHPTFLYELLWNLVVAAVVVWADRRFRLGHGRAFAVYVAGYTLGRFFIELMRTDPATRVFGDIRINVVVAVLVFLGAVAYLVKERRPREVLPWPAHAHGGPDAPVDPAPVDPAAATEEMAVPVGATVGSVEHTAASAGATAVPVADTAGSVEHTVAPIDDAPQEELTAAPRPAPAPAPAPAPTRAPAASAPAEAPAPAPAVDQATTTTDMPAPAADRAVSLFEPAPAPEPAPVPTAVVEPEPEAERGAPADPDAREPVPADASSGAGGAESGPPAPGPAPRPRP